MNEQQVTTLKTNSTAAVAVSCPQMLVCTRACEWVGEWMGECMEGLFLFAAVVKLCRWRVVRLFPHRLFRLRVVPVRALVLVAEAYDPQRFHSVGQTGSRTHSPFCGPTPRRSFFLIVKVVDTTLRDVDQCRIAG
jgi:hypothetical protein